MKNSIDYSPLATYSRLFLFFRLVRRTKMIAVRIFWIILVLGFVGWLIYTSAMINQAIDKGIAGSASTQTYSYAFNSDDYNLVPFFLLMILFIVVPPILTQISMSSAWDKFAKVNGFTRIMSSSPQSLSILTIPSFRGKLLSASFGPISGEYRGVTFALHSREYKEGGILRWRERQMDTILTLILPAELPHIIINAKANERARRSNMTASYPGENKFQFEGTYGTNYDIYTDPGSRIVALQLFTPDVLEVLYTRLPTADIELRGDKLWIIQRYGVLDDNLAPLLIDASAALYAELNKQLRVAGLLNPEQQSTKN